MTVSHLLEQISSYEFAARVGVASDARTAESIAMGQPEAKALLDAARTDWDKKVAERLVAKSHYYDVARELAARVSRFPVDEDGKRHFVVCSGGGPSWPRRYSSGGKLNHHQGERGQDGQGDYRGGENPL